MNSELIQGKTQIRSRYIKIHSALLLAIKTAANENNKTVKLTKILQKKKPNPGKFQEK